MEDLITAEQKVTQKQAFALMLLCSALWSTSGVLIKYLPWGSLTIAGFRSMLAILSMMFYLNIIRKKRIIINKAVLLTAVAISIKYLTFVSANKLTAAANVIALQYTNPIYVLIVTAIISKRMPQMRDILVIVLTMTGISLFFVGEFDKGGILGNILAAVCGMGTAVMYLMSSRFSTFEEGVSSIIIGHVFTVIISMPFIIKDDIEFTGLSVAAILFLGIVQQGVAYSLYSVAIRSGSAVACSIVAMIEPILNPILVFAALGEMPSDFAIIGAGIVILSISAWSFLNVKSAKAETV